MTAHGSPDAIPDQVYRERIDRVVATLAEFGPLLDRDDLAFTIEQKLAVIKIAVQAKIEATA